MTPFEQKIAATSRREIPPEWRARILENAHSKRPPFLLALLRIFLWPHPLAWGAVAAAWVVIAALNFSGPRGEELYAVTPKEFRGKQPVNVREYFVQVQWRQELLRAGFREHDSEIASRYVLDPKAL